MSLMVYMSLTKSFIEILMTLTFLGEYLLINYLDAMQEMIHEEEHAKLEGKGGHGGGGGHGHGH